MKHGPLPPLRDRETRVRLLAWTYPDAAEAGSGSGGLKRHESGIPSRDGYYWARGSYKQLEQALDTLRIRDRALYRDAWAKHVGKLTWQSSTGLGVLAAMMSRPPIAPEGASIYVPISVSVSAGYLASDAEAWASPFDDKAEYL